jgi:hypothetical protein
MHCYQGTKGRSRSHNHPNIQLTLHQKNQPNLYAAILGHTDSRLLAAVDNYERCGLKRHNCSRLEGLLESYALEIRYDILERNPDLFLLVLGIVQECRIAKATPIVEMMMPELVRPQVVLIDSHDDDLRSSGLRQSVQKSMAQFGESRFEWYSQNFMEAR